jgi:cytochrome b6-f complex iron-sulfur subunit
LVKQRSTRREFCAQACGVAGIVALGSALESCGSPGGASATLPVVTGTAASGVVTLAVGAGSPLADVGSAALVQSSSGTFLVSHTGAEAFSALTSICTHETCTITGFDTPDFVCPCHGSRFGTSGAVLSGPATRPLRAFQTRFADGLLTIVL